MTAVGFEPTQLALVELESTPLDHSGKLSCLCQRMRKSNFLEAGLAEFSRTSMTKCTLNRNGDGDGE